MVSVVGVDHHPGCSWCIVVGLLDLDPTWSNVVAVMLCAVPVFLLNKRWVWNADGKVSLRREILPVLGVHRRRAWRCPPLLVAVAESVSDSTLLVMAASIAGFGLLWVAKFLFLDQIMFGHSEKEEVLSQEEHPAV